MAEDNPQSHFAATKSLAYLQEQGKVSNYQVPQNQEHVTHNPSDLQDVIDAQKVTTNVDNFVVPEEQPVELQSGPPKKYIDGGPNDGNTEQADAQQTETNNVSQSDAVNGAGDDPMDSFVPSVNDQQKQEYDDMFAGNDIQPDPVNNANGNAANDDLFGNMDKAQDAVVPDIGIGGDDGRDAANDANGGDDAEQKQEAKQTFLSVWQEEHREQLAKKAKEERDAKDKLMEEGKRKLEEFNEQRKVRIEQQRKDAQGRESDLRDDYNAVFQHGTIWQQVAKLCDLKTKNKGRERMKDLLIKLKNDSDAK